MEMLKGDEFLVDSVVKKERKRHPALPFTTSSLQQEAARKLNFRAKKTMMLAQQLYEGIEIGKEGTVGLITYMRTDSTRILEYRRSRSKKRLNILQPSLARNSKKRVKQKLAKKAILKMLTKPFVRQVFIASRVLLKLIYLGIN